MSFSLRKSSVFDQPLESLPSGKLLINTINAHSYNVAQKDDGFAESLKRSDVLLPDGVSIVMAMRFLQGSRIKKIAGQDLFYYEMNRLNRSGGTCFFLGSKESTLQIIHSKALKEFPHVKVHSYSPPFKPVFSDSDNESMLSAVNAVKPDVLFIGMTAPKQEKWACQHLESLAAQHICCIGAVFDFYSGNYKRAPSWMIVAGLEWLYRLILEPSRMWRRYVLGNPRFILSLFREKFSAYTTQ